MNITDKGQFSYLDISEVGITDGLVGYWKLSGDVRDYSGNNNDGTIFGSAPVTGGLKNMAYSFDGSSQYIDTNTNLSGLLISDLTVSCWVNPSATQIDYADIIGMHTGSFTGWAIQQNTSNLNQYSLVYGDGSNWGGWTNCTVILTSNEWQLITFTKSATQILGFRNGVLVDTYAHTTNLVPVTSPNVKIGLASTDTSRKFTGKIADARIYNRALSNDEIEIQYKYGLPNTGMQMSKDGTLYVNKEIKEGL